MATTTPYQPTREEITARARRYFEESGAPEGRDDEFWLRAEQDLMNEERQSNDPRTEAPASTRATSASSGEELS
jgi:hypothetical protein